MSAGTTDELITKLCAGQVVQPTASNDVLQAIFDGYPAAQLSRLLSSSHLEAIKAGVWIASELAGRAPFLVGDLIPLLHNPETYVRYYATEAIFTNSTADMGAAIARAIEMLDDPESIVRGKVMQMLGRLPKGVLSNSAQFLPDNLSRLLDWLLEPDAKTLEDIFSRLRSARADERRFAAAAILRLGREVPIAKEDLPLLDEEISEFLTSELGRRTRRVI